MKKIIYGILCLVLISQAVKSQSIQIKVIETSDVHGAMFDYDFKNDTAAGTSLAKIFSYVKTERNKPGQKVILLDGGDILQGQPVVYYYNFEKTNKPHIVADVMNYMGYDAAAVGNHDIEAGHPVYDRVKRDFRFPWMAANAVNNKTGKPYFTPYKIIKYKGIKIAVLGLITPAIPNWLPEKIWEGIEFQDMIKSASVWAERIRAAEKPDVLIGLFHSGVEYTYNNQKADDEKNENASQLVAEQVNGFDIIFTGHDHKIWNKKVKGPSRREVLIVGPAGEAGSCAVADIKLSFDRKARQWKKEISGATVYAKNYNADADFVKHFSKPVQEVREYVNKPIGEFSRGVSTRESFFGDSPFIDLIHNIQLKITGADVSFSAPLSFDAEVKKGAIYVRDMFKLYKYENLLYTMELTGKEIKDYLEYSYSLWFNTMKSGNDHLMNFKKNDNGEIISSADGKHPVLANQYYNFSSAAGISYTVDVSKPAGSRINIISMSSGAPFDAGKKYRVAVNSYRGNGGGGHLTEGAGIPKNRLPERVITSTEKDLRYFLMQNIRHQHRVDPAANGNWRVIPEDWWQAGKERDYELIFGR